MNSLALYGVGGLVVLAVVWYVLRLLRKSGVAEHIAEDQAQARTVEQEMTDEMMKPRSMEETRRKLDEGTF